MKPSRANLFACLLLLICLAFGFKIFSEQSSEAQEPQIPGTVHYSESRPTDKKFVKALAASIYYCDLGRLDLYEKYGRENLLNAVRHLTPSGDPDAEYVVGWLFDNGGMRVDLPSSNGLLGAVYDRATCDSEHAAALQWYGKAFRHGSGQAATALAAFESDVGKREDLLRFAIAHGVEDAKIQLAELLESTNAKEAVRLLEEVARSKNRDTVDYALICLLQIWHKHGVKPSIEFRGDTGSAFEFVRKYNPTLSDTDFVHFFVLYGCTPEPYSQLRWQVLRNIRKGCGLHSECIEIAP
ncbi:MAG TPA: hypothetical protein V6C97_19570 [Oculatellaceae cyanobacterium]